MKYALMLQRYLRDKFPKQWTAKLAEGMMLLHYAAELYKFHSQRLPF
jgi:hypothetical protein